MSAGRADITGVEADAPQKVAFEIADFLVRTETERVELFRRHLQATVRKVSPLLLDLAILQGVRLAGAVWAMRPPQDWPWRPLDDVPPGLVRRLRLTHYQPNFSKGSVARRFERHFASPGVVIRGVGDPAGALAIRPIGKVLGFSAEVGACVLTAFTSTAQLRLPTPLPETLAMAMPGCRLDRIVDHAIIAGRDYTVRRVILDTHDGLPVIFFSARLVPMAFPWAHAAGAAS